MSTLVPNEPKAPEAAGDQDLEADNTAEPDASSDIGSHDVLVSHCPAQKDNPRH